MDVKGIAWAANIYQKFEAMCLEVEEIMYQDTVKYVENQVQTVGASVKKFYSDVVEDKVPPSSLDPGKVVSSEFLLEQLKDIEMCKKPKPVVKKEPLKVDIGQLRKRPKAPGDLEKTRVAVTPVRGTRGVDNSFLYPVVDSTAKGARPGLLAAGKLNDGNSAEPSGASLSSRKTVCHSVEVPNRNLETPSASLASSESDQGDLVGESNDETETRNEAIPDPSRQPLPSNTNMLDSELARSSGWEDSVSTSESFSALSTGLVSACPDDFSAADISLDNSSVSFGASFMDEGFSSNVYREIGFSNSEFGPVDRSDKAKLEESCIIVNTDELQFVSVAPGKSRTYKKKFRDALSSRKRGSRAQEYKQLTAQFSNNAKSDNDVATKSGTAPIGESEWELL